MKKPGSKNIESNPKLLTLASFLTQYATKRHTTTSIDLSMYLHGLTRNKKLIDIFHKEGNSISYADVLMLHDEWVVNIFSYPSYVSMNSLLVVQASSSLTIMISRTMLSQELAHLNEPKCCMCSVNF